MSAMMGHEGHAGSRTISTKGVGGVRTALARMRLWKNSSEMPKTKLEKKGGTSNQVVLETAL